MLNSFIVVSYRIVERGNVYETEANKKCPLRQSIEGPKNPGENEFDFFSGGRMLAAKICATVFAFSTNLYITTYFMQYLKQKLERTVHITQNCGACNALVAPTYPPLRPSAVNTCEFLHIKFCL